MPCPVWESPGVSGLPQGPSPKLPGRRRGHSTTWTKRQTRVQEAISLPSPQELHPTCHLNFLVSSNQCPPLVSGETRNSPLQRTSRMSHLRDPTPQRLPRARISLQPSSHLAARSTRTRSRPFRSPEIMRQPTTGPTSTRPSQSKPHRMPIRTSLPTTKETHHPASVG